MMYAMRSLMRTALVLMLSIIRSKALISLMIVLLVPSTILSIIINGQHLIQDQSNILLENYKGSPIVLIQQEPKSKDYLKLQVLNVIIRHENYSVSTLIYLVENINAFLKTTRVRIIKSIEEINGSCVSLGIRISNRLNIPLGSNIILYVNNSPLPVKVIALHRGSGIYDYIVLAKGIVNSSNRKYYLFRANSSTLVSSIINDLNNDFSLILTILAVPTMLFYSIIVFLAFLKLIKYIEVDIQSLVNLGIPLSTIRISYAVASTILGVLFIIYGLSLGTMLVHLSIWIARFYNIYFTSRPLIPLWEVVKVIGAYIPLLFTLSYLSFKGMSER